MFKMKMIMLEKSVTFHRRFFLGHSAAPLQDLGGHSERPGRRSERMPKLDCGVHRVQTASQGLRHDDTCPWGVQEVESDLCVDKNVSTRLDDCPQ